MLAPTHRHIPLQITVERHVSIAEKISDFETSTMGKSYGIRYVSVPGQNTEELQINWKSHQRHRQYTKYRRTPQLCSKVMRGRFPQEFLELKDFQN